MANELKDTSIGGNLYVHERIYKYNYQLGRYTEIGVDVVPATTVSLGGIIVGKNLTITRDGVLSARAYIPATQEYNGLMSAYDKAKIDSIDTNANYYVLPIASDNVLGGVKIKDDSLIIKEDDGSITVNIGTKYIPGLLQVGDNINVNSKGIISLDMAEYTPEKQVNGLLSYIDKDKLNRLKTVALTGSYNDLVDRPPTIGVFNLKGKIQYPVMIALEDAKVGDVWTISEDYTIPTTGEVVKAGSNYVCVADTSPEDVGSDHWNLFDPSAALDLTKYVSKAELYVAPEGKHNIIYTGSWKDLVDLGLATADADGLMSRDDKARIDMLHEVAISGDYYSLKNLPTLSDVAISGDFSDLLNIPNFATIATSGKYSDLLEKPTSVDGIVPPGTVLMFAGENIPDGYLLCNGSAPKRADYPALFAKIGVKYGPGNGSTTFNLPDFHNKVPEGTKDISMIGKYVEAGLPNIIGTSEHEALNNKKYYGDSRIISMRKNGVTPCTSGAFFAGDATHTYSANTCPGGDRDNVYDSDSLYFDAEYGRREWHKSKYGTDPVAKPIYGNSDTVQMNALYQFFIIKY